MFPGDGEFDTFSFIPIFNAYKKKTITFAITLRYQRYAHYRQRETIVRHTRQRL